MTRHLTIPRVTSICVALMAAVAVCAGAALALFSIDAWWQQAEDRVAAGRALPERGRAAPQRADVAGSAVAVGMLAAWRDVPGIAAAARVLIASRGAGGRARRLIDIADALTLNPTAGWLWLAYADAVLRRGLVDDAVKALDMSIMTERREAATVLARTFFVLRAWEHIPDDRRAAVLTQFAGLRRRLGQAETAAVEKIIVRKNPRVRAEIAAALAPRLGRDPGLLDRLGLPIPPAVTQSTRRQAGGDEPCASGC